MMICMFSRTLKYLCGRDGPKFNFAELRPNYSARFASATLCYSAEFGYSLVDWTSVPFVFLPRTTSTTSTAYHH